MRALKISEPLRSVLPALTERFRAGGWWGDETFGSYAERWAEHDPEHLGLRDDYRTLTRAEYVAAAKALASALARRGVGPGSIVGLQLPNTVDYGVANLACEYLGAVWVNLATTYREHELHVTLGHLEADVLFVPASYSGFDYRPMVALVQAAVPSLRTIVTPSREPVDGWLAMHELVAETPTDELEHLRLGADDIFAIMLSSGTTSARPKEALRSSNTLVAALRIMNETLLMGPEDRLFTLAPLTGGTGYTYSVGHALLTGCSSDVSEHRIGPALVSRLVNARPTVMVAVPTQMSRLLDQAGGDRSMWSDLRLIINSGAPLLGEVAARAEAAFDCSIISVYGATDGLVPVMTAVDAPPEIRHSRVGRVIKAHKLRLVDPQGREVAPGEVGEILGFGPGMALGYVDNPEEMVASWDDQGWWHSGDLGTLDDEGYLRVVGRKKDVILRGGMKISPLEIEELLNRHPDVAEAVVVAIPHPDLYEQACAVLVIRGDMKLTLSDVSTYLLEGGVAKYKLPERLELRAAIPRTSAQKIDRLLLQKELAAIVENERV